MRLGLRCLTFASLLVFSVFGWTSCNAANQEAPCTKFVQSFYNWYVLKSKNSLDKNGSPLEVALKERGDCFDSDLSKALKDDVAASAKSPGDVVGLDFDPILNTQEEPQRYEAGKATQAGSSFLVDIYGYSNGKKSDQPVVQPELNQAKGKWQFVNFHYQVDNKNDDLVHILKRLRDNREQYKK